jgi:hypothetical protein
MVRTFDMPSLLAALLKLDFISEEEHTEIKRIQSLANPGPV